MQISENPPEETRAVVLRGNYQLCLFKNIIVGEKKKLICFSELFDLKYYIAIYELPHC